MKKACLVILALSLTLSLHAADSKKNTTEDESTLVGEETIGNVKVTAKAKNTDFISQRRAEWKDRQKKRKSEEGESARSKDKDKEEEDYSPEVSVTFKWPAKN